EDAKRAARRTRRHGEEDIRQPRRYAGGRRADTGVCLKFVIPGRCEASNPESRDSGFALCAPRNDNNRDRPMTFHKRREALRSILTGSRCIRPGSVYDATSIRIAHDLGFEVGMFGGSVASLAVLGDPDIALITLTELAEQMR